MKLKTFIKKYVEPNTIIRLHYKIEGGHKEISEPEMEWKLKFGEFADNEVIGVTDILYKQTHFPEAVNISIKPLKP